MADVKDLSKITFGGGFSPKNPQLVLDTGRDLIIAYENEFKGRKYYRIHQIYEQYGEWHPGKMALGVPAEHKDKFLEALRTLANHELRTKAA